MSQPPVPPERPDEVTSPPPGEPQPPGSEFAEFFHTEDLPDKPQRVSHRGAIEASPIMQRLLAPVTAVVVVVVVILLLIWINGGSSGSKQSPAAVGPAPRTTAPVVPTSRHPSSPTPTSPATTAPPVTGHSSPAKPSTATGGTGATGRQSRPATSTARAPVTVLNNSRRTGLAAAVAAELRGRKWQVAGVGNQTQVIPVTTVYYPPGQHAAAVHLAHDFASVQRIEPATGAGRHGAGLTLVVTQSWVL